MKELKEGLTREEEIRLYQIRHVPTPDQIEQRAEEIRKGWVSKGKGRSDGMSQIKDCEVIGGD